MLWRVSDQRFELILRVVAKLLGTFLDNLVLVVVVLNRHK